MLNASFHSINTSKNFTAKRIQMIRFKIFTETTVPVKMIRLCVYACTYTHMCLKCLIDRTNLVFFNTFRTSFLEIFQKYYTFKVILKMQSIYGLKGLGVEGLGITKEVKTALRSKQDFASPPGNQHPVYPEWLWRLGLLK